MRDDEKRLVEIAGVTGNGRTYSMHRDVRRRKDGSWPREIVRPLQVGDRTYRQVLHAEVVLTDVGPGRRPVLRAFLEAVRETAGANARAASPCT